MGQKKDFKGKWLTNKQVQKFLVKEFGERTSGYVAGGLSAQAGNGNPDKVDSMVIILGIWYGTDHPEKLSRAAEKLVRKTEKLRSKASN